MSDNLKFKGTGYLRKTDTGYDKSTDEQAEGTNVMYAIQSSLENKKQNNSIHLPHMFTYMIGCMMRLKKTNIIHKLIP